MLWTKGAQQTAKFRLKFTKLEEKFTCGVENDMRNLVNFHQSTQKSQDWDFDGILLSKVENVWG